jgi:hypothetical protein
MGLDWYACGVRTPDQVKRKTPQTSMRVVPGSHTVGVGKGSGGVLSHVAGRTPALQATASSARSCLAPAIGRYIPNGGRPLSAALPWAAILWEAIEPEASALIRTQALGVASPSARGTSDTPDCPKIPYSVGTRSRENRRQVWPVLPYIASGPPPDSVRGIWQSPA